MAGEAERVARVVTGVVNGVGVSETGRENETRTDGKRQDGGADALGLLRGRGKNGSVCLRIHGKPLHGHPTGAFERLDNDGRSPGFRLRAPGDLPGFPVVNTPFARRLQLRGQLRNALQKERYRIPV